MSQHLWEVKHTYYCNEGNYYARESVGAHYKSLASFLVEEGDADIDYNLVFRWDWVEGEDHDLPPYNGDVNYRSGVLKVFFMGQRKGLYRYATVEVCRADEEGVIAYLSPRMGHLLQLWSPISGVFNG
jgi:hypothetical protein